MKEREKRGEGNRIMIQEILVLKEGVPLFWYGVVESELKDPLLVSGFLNTVFQIAKTEFKEGISTIKIGSSYVHLKEVSQILVVVVSDSEDEVERVAERVGIEFLKEYGEYLENWNGEVGIFRDFREKIIQILGRKATAREELENTLKKIIAGPF
ncbi:MAG: hypothetical protein KIH01_01745 [Candidatus Freyarchaeota archaeon]|nr:hypothetical protein [Candidatus Jordarchaeia archaeon]